ncbi:MFS transporter [Variovorax sp. WS11]|uniref:MFS transporter n=1 Tax=Variovorax sp. WS11 TaxID=1105204 RepID=UPI000D0D5484|nr:MFS transporter [Variovorax sp. WS11]NDZ12737.1 MHS family MFS transporter [Variovorax sp. WS11]PSL84676.1 MFS transporter [Variovorax sp. WS11]
MVNRHQDTDDTPVTPGRVATASMVGTVMEWYDFFLYGFVAALVFGQLFFPKYSAVAGTLASFATLAVGFVARPLGGVIFGHFGDRIGRKTMLITTLTLMGGSTFAIGLLPTYESIGLWAAVLLTVCRFLQGVALGGEWGGAVLMAVEYAPPRRRGFFGSVVQTGATVGLALATVVLFIASYYLSKEDFLAWGWRVPFLLSIVMLISGLYIRMKVTETPAFRSVQEAGKIAKYPIVEVLRDHPKVVICTALVYLGAITVPFYTVWVFLTYYATSVLKLDRSMVLLGVVVVTLFLTLVILFAGSLSDRIGKKTILVVGCLVTVAVAFPFFTVLDLREIKWVWVAMLMMATPLWVMWAVLPAYFTEQFPEQLRYTGISLGSQAATIVGGLVPLFATAVLPQYGTWPISVLVLVCVALSLGAILALNRGELARSTRLSGARTA